MEASPGSVRELAGFKLADPPGVFQGGFSPDHTRVRGIETKDIIHYRHGGLDPRNDRAAISELKAAGARTVCSINEADGFIRIGGRTRESALERSELIASRLPIVLDTTRAIADVAIDDGEASLLRVGEPAVVKLNSFPTRVFHGDVVIVSPKGMMQGESRVFFARVAVPNADGTIRAGMEGRGKVRTGWYPAGYAFFRKPLLWLYSRIWTWFGV